MRLVEVNLFDILSQFPETKRFDLALANQLNFDFFLSALGFEERTLAFPKSLSLIENFICGESIYFQYETSTTENAFNEPKLIEFCKKISNNVSKLFCDEQGFANRLNEIIYKKSTEKEKVKVMFDISVCSSKLILTTIKILLNLNIDLTIVYAEAADYFPFYPEYVKNKSDFKNVNTVSNETVVLSTEYSGGNKIHPDLIVSFPNFKAQRAKNIISEIDETILLKPDDSLIWIIGDPNMEIESRNSRKRMMQEINDIPDDAIIHEVSTLYYKKTIEKLETIYQNHNLTRHINIADLGSKMQTLAIAIYCHIRPEISIYYTSPKTYNTNKYSTGIKDYWIIEFGSTTELMEKINSVDMINIDF